MPDLNAVLATVSSESRFKEIEDAPFAAYCPAYAFGNNTRRTWRGTGLKPLFCCCGTKLALKEAPHATPELPHLPSTLTIKSIKMCAQTFFLATAARGDLFGTPLSSPSNLATINPVV